MRRVVGPKGSLEFIGFSASLRPLFDRDERSQLGAIKALEGSDD
jgi:hypothetical protein